MKAPSHPGTLLIVAECEHWRQGGRTFAPSHFVREIELWASMFPRVVLFTRFPPGPRVPQAVPYQAPNVRFRKGNGALAPGGCERLKSLGRSALLIPGLFLAYARADFVHVRCPTRNGLFALLLQRFFRKPCYVKWAANWELDANSPRTSHWQKHLIRSNPGPTVATVYHRLPDDPAHVHPVDTASLSRDELEACLGRPRAAAKDDRKHLVWVGRFSPNKNADGLFDAFRAAVAQHGHAHLDLVGDGPRREALAQRVKAAGLENRVTFHGHLAWERLSEVYASAYLNLLPSYSEGFPKVVHEAAAFGVPSVVFAVGALPRIVEGRGVVVSEVGNMSAYAEAIGLLLADEQRWQTLSRQARHWAAGLCIEDVVDRLRRLLEAAWRVTLPRPGFRGPAEDQNQTHRIDGGG